MRLTLLCWDPRVIVSVLCSSVFCPVLGGREVLQFRLAVIERVVVDVVAFYTRGRVHDFPVHADGVSFAVADKASGGVEALSPVDQSPVEFD